MYSVVYRIRKGFKLTYTLIKTSHKKDWGLTTIYVLNGTRSSLPIYGISSPLTFSLYSFSVSQPRVWFWKKKNLLFLQQIRQQRKALKRNVSCIKAIKVSDVIKTSWLNLVNFNSSDNITDEVQSWQDNPQAAQAQCVSFRIVNTCSFILRNLKWPWI